MTDDTTEGGDPTDTKVGRLIEAYDLDGVGAELERRWTADGDQSRSLRELADDFNQRLLQAAMTEAGMSPLDGDVENVFRLLTGESATSGARTEAASRLAKNGIDVDELRDEFVSYQAVRTYLREYRGVTYDADSGDRLTATRESVGRLKGRLVTVTEDKLSTLRADDEIDAGELTVLATVQVFCEDCETTYTVEEFLDRGRCGCAPTTGEP